MIRYSIHQYCTADLAGVALEGCIVESINKVVSAQSVTKGQIKWAVCIFHEISSAKKTDDAVLLMMNGISSISKQPIDMHSFQSIQYLCKVINCLWENFSVEKDLYDPDEHDDEAQKLHELYQDETILRVSNLVTKFCEDHEISTRDNILPVWIKALEKMVESCNEDWDEEISCEIRAIGKQLASIFQPHKNTLPWDTKFSALILFKHLLKEGNQKEDSELFLNHKLVKRLGKVFFTDQEDVEATVVSDNFVTFCSQLVRHMEGKGVPRYVVLDPKLLEPVLVNIPTFINKAIEQSHEQHVLQYDMTSYNGCDIIMAIVKCKNLSDNLLLKILDIDCIECMVKCVETFTTPHHVLRIHAILQSFVLLIEHTSSSNTLSSKAIKSIVPVFATLSERFMDREYSPNRGGMFRNLYTLVMSLLCEVSTKVRQLKERDSDDPDIARILRTIDDSGIIETISHVVTTCNSTEEDSVKEATRKALMPFVCDKDAKRGRDLVIRLAKCLPSLIGRLDTELLAYALAFAIDEIIEVYQTNGKITHFQEMAAWLCSGSVDITIPFYLRARWNLANSHYKEISSAFSGNLEAVIDTLKRVFKESELYKLDTLRQLARLSSDIIILGCKGAPGLRLACKKLVSDNPDRIIIGFLSVALL